MPSNGGAVGSLNIVYTPPERYDEHVAAFNGKPGVYFGGSTKNTGSNELWTSSKTTTRTLFLVCSCDGQPDGQSGFWGSTASERGMVISSWSNGKWNIRQYTGTTYHRYGRLLRATGPDGASVDYTWATNDRDWPMPATFILAAQNDDASGNFSSYKNQTFILGRVYHRGTKAWYGEVIGYDRVLSAEEVRSVERYLRNKWFTTASVAPVPSVTPGTPVAVANGGRVDFGGQDVTVSTLHAGDGTLANFGLLTIAEAIELELDAAGCVIPLTLAGDVVFGGAGRTIPVSIAGGAQPARSPSVQEAVRVTEGTVTGDLVKDAALRRVNLNRGGDVWSFVRLGMTVIVR